MATISQLKKAATAARAAADADKDNEELAKAAAAAEAALADAEAPKPDTIEVRVLVDSGDYAVNTVADLTPEAAAAAVAEGWADDNPAAVAYAKSLKAEA